VWGTSGFGLPFGIVVMDEVTESFTTTQKLEREQANTVGQVS
jgi:hypothetical protein